MATSYGFEAILNYRIGGQGSGGWNPLNLTKNATLNQEADEYPATTRGSAGYKESEPTLIGASIEAELLYDPEDAGCAAVESAFFAREKIGLQALDKDGNGIQGDFKVFSFSRAEQLAEGLAVTVTFKPCHSDTPISRLP